MRFKTIIKLISDANNKNEALEIVEDYLAGNIVSGVDMKCVTRPLHNKAMIAGVAAVIFIVSIGAFLLLNIRHIPNSLPVISGMGAVQPPLITAATSRKEENFKRNWQDRQTKEALDYIIK